MSKRDARLLLMDMQEAVESILLYTHGLDFKSFCADKKTVDAVLRNLTVLGEACRQVPDEFKAGVPEIEWTKIARSRNIVVHDYFCVDPEIIWRIISTYQPPLGVTLKDVISKA